MVAVTVGDTILNITPIQTTVSVTPVVETIVQAFPAGLKGDKGDAADGIVTTTPIGESFSGHTVIASLGTGLVIADNTNVSHIGKVIGITSGSSTSGMPLTLTTSGGTLNGFTGLSTGSVYFLSTGGTITNSTPTVGFIQQVGIALSTTELNINILSPIATS